MDPPTLIVAVNRSASSHELIERTGRFSINVLPIELAAFSKEFSERPKTSRFDPTLWFCSSRFDQEFTGVPHLCNAQSVILCSTFRQVDVGTHSLFLADVRFVSIMGPHRPLVYVDGKYGGVERFGFEAASAASTTLMHTLEKVK
jgi:flavin reductase (DIM6/NTAB) family NADH-FMN oxidoreductase RutF